MCRISILADIIPMGYKLSCCGSLWSRREYRKIRKRHKAHNRHYRSYTKHNRHNRIYKISNIESRMFVQKTLHPKLHLGSADCKYFCNYLYELIFWQPMVVDKSTWENLKLSAMIYCMVLVSLNAEGIQQKDSGKPNTE